MPFKQTSIGTFYHVCLLFMQTNW